MKNQRTASPLNRVFGLNVKRARYDRRWTQKMLEEKSQVSHATISDVETGNRGVSLDIAVRIARALGLSLDVLLKEPPSAR